MNRLQHKTFKLKTLPTSPDTLWAPPCLPAPQVRLQMRTGLKSSPAQRLLGAVTGCRLQRTERVECVSDLSVGRSWN